MQNTYERYSQIKKRIKELEVEAEHIAKEISEDLEAMDENKVENEYGKFYFMKRKKWKYTPEVTDLEKKFKARKAYEEEVGIASFEESKSLAFREIENV